MTSSDPCTVTFFYPSTEWELDQPFDCRCGARVRTFTDHVVARTLTGRWRYAKRLSSSVLDSFGVRSTLHRNSSLREGMSAHGLSN